MKQMTARGSYDPIAQVDADDEVLAIEQDGQMVGFFILSEAGRTESPARALQRLEQIVTQMHGEERFPEEHHSHLKELAAPLLLRPVRRRRKPASGTLGCVAS